MILSEVVQLGDKIDIKMKKHTEGKLSEVSFQSSVCDFLSDWEIEIGMPSYEGRMVLFQIGAECNFIFYTKRGMYQCANGKCLNADVNGALNILRKSNVVSLDALYTRGEVDTPVRIRIA